MLLLNIAQSTRFILSAVSACVLVACTVEGWLMQVPPTPTKEACQEAAEYSQRAAAADDERVRAALQRIADTKSRDCAAKTGVSDASSVPADGQDPPMIDAMHGFNHVLPR